MTFAIVVGSHRNSPWVEQCLNSIPAEFPVIVARTGGYECGAIAWTMNNTTLDRFLFLQDSTRVKDPAWLRECMGSHESICCNAEPRVYGSYLGVWRRSVLQQCVIPVTTNKLQAVLAEMSLPEQYAAIDPPRILWPEFTLQHATPELMFEGTPHERLTMRYENDHLIKWKSCYSGDHVDDAQERDHRTARL